ncbi:hypothetical protein BLNAU_19857 [Blattamonas nauphoetae]|uniref:Uncharacterized protein n=1 Tax=Blattamonas nauphoetae TaxID=2049346 RepID=A0ABQ9X0J6_9EUKA|nr:hypothetical protein BLNAU_19857 [Blattamonas nauphoetae]
MPDSQDPMLNPIFEHISPPSHSEDDRKTKVTSLAKILISLACNEAPALKISLLDVLFVVASETEHGLDFVLQHAPVPFLAQLCVQMPLSSCPLSLPQLLLLIGMSSEDENVRICESSLPSSLLGQFVATRNVLVRLSIGKCIQMMTSTPASSSAFLSYHETAFRTTLEEIEKSDLSAFFLESLAAIMFSPNATVFELVFQSLSRHARNQEAASLLANHRLIFSLSDPAVKTVTFIERLSEVLTDHLLQIKSLFTSSTVPHQSLEKSTFTTIGDIWDFVVSKLHFLDQLCNLNHLAKSENTQAMVSIINVGLDLIKSSPIPTPTTSPFEESSIVSIHNLWSFVNNRISFCNNLLLLRDDRYVELFVSAIDVGLSKTNELVHTSATLTSAAVTSLHHTLEIVSSGVTILFERITSRFYHSLIEKITHASLPTVKTAITTCLELPSHLTNVPTDQKDALNATINSVLTMSWKIITRSLVMSMKSLNPILESLFVEGPDLFTLVEQISRHFNTNLLMDILSLTNNKPSETRAIFIFLKENMIERMFERVRPTAVPLADRDFHSHVLSLIWNMTRGTFPDFWKREEKPFEPLLQFNRVVVPSQPYLLFVFQRDEYLATPDGLFESHINRILENVMRLEKELYSEGLYEDIGRESWEVGWLVEKTDEKSLCNRLSLFKRNDELLKDRRWSRWKRRVERLRQVGAEDVVEAWLPRTRHLTVPNEVEAFICRVTGVIGSNHASSSRVYRRWRE